MGWKDDYRRQAAQHVSEAEELESGRSRRGNVGGSDESESWAKRKRGIAAKLRGLASANEDD
jgi:hypothetical protein